MTHSITLTGAKAEFSELINRFDTDVLSNIVKPKPLGYLLDRSNWVRFD